MKFWKTVGESIYSPRFYRGLLSKPLSFSLKYFYLLAAVLAILVAAKFALFGLPAVQTAIGTLESKAPGYFPDGLEITLKKGVVSTNIQEPYFIKFPEDIQNGVSSANQGTASSSREKLPTNFLVIDTREPFSLDKFRAYDTEALLTAHELVLANSPVDVRIYSLGRVPDATIDKAWVGNMMRRISPILRFVSPLLVLLVLLFIMILMTFHLVYLFFGALLVWLVLRIKNVRVGYGAAYRVGLHAMTLSVLVGTIGNFILPISIPIPFLFTILMLVTVAVNCGGGDSPASSPSAA